MPPVPGLNIESIDLLELSLFKLELLSDDFEWKLPPAATGFSLLTESSSDEYWFSSSE